MAAQIAIIHGWSDTSKSFRDLRDFLVANGYDTKQIWLSDYISLDDDVRVEDVAKRMHAVLAKALQDGELKAPFDMIVHSTGGLVAREWLARNFPDGKGAPVKRLIMLAPANFGSRLASLGKSMIGRVAKGWNNWFQTGAEMLVGLELASPYQWDLARRDLFDPIGNAAGPYGTGKVWPFVIVGTHPYPSGLRQIVNENGSDGTVRPAAANLNAVGLTIDFSAPTKEPPVTAWHRRCDVQIPFAILPDRDHSSIHEPASPSGAAKELSDALGKLLLDALHCNDDAAHAALAAAWNDRNEATTQLSRDPNALSQAFKLAPDPEALHQYMQVVAFVRDDEGQPVSDYFLEFFSPDKAGSAEAVFFHQKVLDDVHVNGQSASRRCLFVDHTALMDGFYGIIRNPAQQEVAVSLSAAKIGPNVRYFDSTKEGAKGHLVVHRKDQEQRDALGAARLRRNMTHLVEIIIPRRPIDKVFTLSS